MNCYKKGDKVICCREGKPVDAVIVALDEWWVRVELESGEQWRIPIQYIRKNKDEEAST